MSAILVGSPASGQKVLRTSNLQREQNGLETLTENYIVRTENLSTIVPARNVLHSAFSTATPKYKRMAVENVSTEQQDGGLSQISVQYVGITINDLPAPVIRLIPVNKEVIASTSDDATNSSSLSYYGEVEAQIEYLTDEPLLSISSQLLKSTPMPTKINNKKIDPFNGTDLENRGRQVSRTVTQDNEFIKYVTEITDYGFILYSSEVISRGIISIVRAFYRQFVFEFSSIENTSPSAAPEPPS